MNKDDYIRLKGYEMVSHPRTVGGWVSMPRVSPAEITDGTSTAARMWSPSDIVAAIAQHESPTPVVSVAGKSGNVLLDDRDVTMGSGTAIYTSATQLRVALEAMYFAIANPALNGGFYPQRSSSNTATTSATEVVAICRGWAVVPSTVTGIECLIGLAAISAQATFTFQYESGNFNSGTFSTVTTPLVLNSTGEFTTGVISPPAGLATGTVRQLRLMIGGSGDSGTATVTHASLRIATVSP